MCVCVVPFNTSLGRIYSYHDGPRGYGILQPAGLLRSITLDQTMRGGTLPVTYCSSRLTKTRERDDEAAAYTGGDEAREMTIKEFLPRHEELPALGRSTWGSPCGGAREGGAGREGVGGLGEGEGGRGKARFRKLFHRFHYL